MIARAHRKQVGQLRPIRVEERSRRILEGIRQPVRVRVFYGGAEHDRS